MVVAIMPWYLLCFTLHNTSACKETNLLLEVIMVMATVIVPLFIFFKFTFIYLFIWVFWFLRIYPVKGLRDESSGKPEKLDKLSS